MLQNSTPPFPFHDTLPASARGLLFQAAPRKVHVSNIVGKLLLDLLQQWQHLLPGKTPGAQVSDRTALHVLNVIRSVHHRPRAYGDISNELE